MQLVVIGTDELVSELTAQGLNAEVQLHPVTSLQDALAFPDVDAYIDLLFEPTDERIDILKKFNKPVIVNSVIKTLNDTANSFCRINGWPTFLKGSIIEASARTSKLKETATIIFQQFNKTIEWLPDDTGFLTPRVISSIINEAYFALSEGVSTKEEIDTAMKLGTAYPYGPFEWGEKIGLRNIAALLTELCAKNTRYAPSPLLVQEAFAK